MNMVDSVIAWNCARYTQVFSRDLTFDLLESELEELQAAIGTVDKVDAYIDIIYVSIGAMWKLGYPSEAISQGIKKAKNELLDTHTLEELFSALKACPPVRSARAFGLLGVIIQLVLRRLQSLGLSTRQVQLCCKAVCKANNSKVAIRTSPQVKANIDKGPNFVPPEREMAKILASSAPQKKGFLRYTPQLLISYAEKSLCKRRKVGAAVVSPAGFILALGHNRPPKGKAVCELEDGTSAPGVVHAERDVVQNMAPSRIPSGCTMYVTHAPCQACLACIANAGIENIVVETGFMKFDSGKLRYDLVPAGVLRQLAEVYTYGAKKYAADNWRAVDSLDKYYAALIRHLEAWRAGEALDGESGLKHLAHAMTNVSFLLELDK